MAHSTKRNDAETARQLIDGTNKRFANAASMAFGGTTYTPTQVTGELQALVTMRSDVDDARAALQAKLAIEKAQAPAYRAFLLAYVAFVRATFGDSVAILADFGLAPKKAPTPLTAEQLVARAAKNRATREARGTVGPRKRLETVGNVTGVTVTPITRGPATPSGAPTAVTAATAATAAPAAAAAGPSGPNGAAGGAPHA